MSDSEGSSDSEIPEESILAEITFATCKGRWQHSLGDYITNRGDSDVVFDQGLRFTLEAVDNTVMLDGWRAVPEKSSANKITWTKDGEKAMFWRFENEVETDADDLKEEVSEDNIVTGKRRRKGVDYAALNKKMNQEQGFEDDEEGGDFDAVQDAERKRARKKAKLDSLAQSLSGSSSSTSQYSSSSSVSSSSSAPAAKKKPLPPKKLSNEELIRIRDQLGLEGPLKPADVVLTALKQLERHPMELDHLKATKIGVVVNRYRKHTNAALAPRIQALVKTWKGLLPKK